MVFKLQFRWSRVFFGQIFHWFLLLECTSRWVLSWNTFIGAKICQMDSLSWRSIFSFIPYFLLRRGLSLFILKFLCNFINGLLPLNKHFFLSLQIFILKRSVTIFLHLFLVHAIIIFSMSFDGIAFPFWCLFLWNTLVSLFWLSFLFIIF